MSAFFSMDDFNNRTNGNPFKFQVDYNADTRAVLYIFSPRQVPDYCVRGYCYNFDNDFVAKAADTVQRSINKGLQLKNTSMSRSDFSKDPIFSRAIAPSAQGNMFDGRYYGGNYTFVLILDNASFEGRFNPAKLNNRLLYGGYFVGEPYTNNTGRVYLNPNAGMVFTHFTHIGVKHAYGNAGPITFSRPFHDIDVVNPMESLQSSPEREYLARPSDYANNISVDSGDVVYVSPETSCLGSTSEKKFINTYGTDPASQLNEILTGMSTAKLQFEGGCLTSFEDNPSIGFQDDYTWTQTLREKMGEGDKLPDRFIGIDLSKVMFLGDLVAKYPILNSTTQVIDIPWDLNDAPMDNRAPNVINVWSSLLMSTIPAVMSSCGISDAIFRYDSVDFNSRVITMQREPVYEVFNIETFIPEENSEFTRMRWNNAITYLKDVIFPIIISHVGNFSVFVKYSSAKECAVQLNLPDCVDYINDGIIINNALFSGHQSPMVIDRALKDANTNEFTALSSIIQSGTTCSYHNSSYNPFGNSYSGNNIFGNSYMWG